MRKTKLFSAELLGIALALKSNIVHSGSVLDLFE